MAMNLSEETKKFLRETASAIVTKGKGILAADESTGTIAKRFATIEVPNEESNRRDYRQLLFTTKNCEKYISGVILFDETFYQKNVDGKRLVEGLIEKNVKIGIKVDKGLEDIPGTDGEKTTKGLDDLAERCAKYKKDGADFAKWRCILQISDVLPSDTAIDSITTVLTEYAAICQQNGLVPIVEPEIMIDGTHSLDRCQTVTEKVLKMQYKKLQAKGVYIPGTLLKPNMVTPGYDCPTKATPEEVAKATIATLKAAVPSNMPGVTFLSGGQSEAEASLNLNAMNLVQDLPWHLSFSYGRALQASVLKSWKGKQDNLSTAQDEFFKRARFNGLATLGKYDPAEENSPAAQITQHAANYVY